MSWPTGTQQGKRWMLAKNMADSDIPPYGVAALWNYDGDEPVVETEEDGTPVFPIYQPNAAIEREQNPGLLVANGPFVIPKGKNGDVTQDWPALVRLDKAYSSVPYGFSVGPIRGSWGVGVKAEGSFVSAGLALPKADKTGFHGLWVSPYRHRQGTGYTLFGIKDDQDESRYSNDQRLKIASGWNWGLWNGSYLHQPITLDGDAEGIGSAIRVNSSGVFVGSFSGVARLGSEDDWSTADNVELQVFVGRYKGAGISDATVSTAALADYDVMETDYVFGFRADTLYVDRVTGSTQVERPVKLSIPFSLPVLLNLVRFDIVWVQVVITGSGNSHISGNMWLGGVTNYHAAQDADNLQSEYPGDLFNS